MWWPCGQTLCGTQYAITNYDVPHGPCRSEPGGEEAANDGEDDAERERESPLMIGHRLEHRRVDSSRAQRSFDGPHEHDIGEDAGKYSADAAQQSP